MDSRSILPGDELHHPTNGISKILKKYWKPCKLILFWSDTAISFDILLRWKNLPPREFSKTMKWFLWLAFRRNKFFTVWVICFDNVEFIRQTFVFIFSKIFVHFYWLNFFDSDAHRRFRLFILRYCYERAIFTRFILRNSNKFEKFQASD